MNQEVKQYLTDEIIKEIEETEKKNFYNLSATWTVYLHIVPKEINKYGFDKYYVGLTGMKPELRWGEKGSRYLSGARPQTIGYAIQKYGWDNMKHYIISCNLLMEEAQKYEKLLICYFNSNDKIHGYNILDGGENPVRKYKHDKKLRNTKAQCYVNKKVAQYNLDGFLIESYSNAKQASIITGIDHRAIKQSAKKEGSKSGDFMWVFFENEPKLKIEPYKIKTTARSVRQFDVFGNFIKEWESMSEAKQKYGNSVSDACYRKQRFSHGYQWRFSDDVNDVEDISYLYEVKDNEINKILIGTFQLYLPLTQIDAKTGEIVNIFKNSDEANNKTGFNKKNYKKLLQRCLLFL